MYIYIYVWVKKNRKKSKNPNLYYPLTYELHYDHKLINK